MATDPTSTGGGDGSDELLIPYPAEDGTARLFGGLFMTALALAPAYLLPVVWADDNGHPLAANEAALLTAVFVLCSAFFVWIATRSLIPWWRITRGTWWLRLSASGLEINDRLGRPQRYRWRDFERFLLVPTPADLNSAELAAQLTFGEKVAQGVEHGGVPVIVVGLVPGFQLAPTYHRSIWHKRINRLYRAFNGPTPDGIVMEFWDRPYDQAVEMLNEWLKRYRNA
ncbi:hypothetical protein [Mycobacterium aquaticum]|uniref:Uncharacterized protein n=1 Tax=Mycobacterium aquaticum TaxID=1927124 RepID=A0A1X0B073_9MYCO|nr:hypothetical protein [Mycobacterium aquaticum]ORA35605.1 hypothetical protein BST13_13695 [Mycobacterium aquaticum]